ncbi:MAG: UDP-N-acetylmuramate dehydrogenase [Prevotella sp.]|nr:UDP-N-acetylmuramate dehydrogenase [Prevotella sp.]
MRDIQNYSLLQHNTFGMDVSCRRFLEYESVEEAQQVAAILRDSHQPFLIIGSGSNLLLTGDYDGIVVHSAIRGIEEHDAMVTAGSGETFDQLISWCIAHGLYGLINLSLIPGDVGASAVQNIGAYGVEVAQYINKVEVVEIATGKVVTILAAECGYAYRQSLFKTEWKNRYLITRVTYQLSTVFEPHIDYGNIRAELERQGIASPSPEQLRQVIIDIRRSKLPDPDVEGNAGSFFVNPIVQRSLFEELLTHYPDMPHYPVDDEHVKIPAGWMIERCGWKGKSLGRAGVHSKQALVLVNRGGATGNDVVTLCRQIQHDVKAMFGVEINPEVNIV